MNSNKGETRGQKLWRVLRDRRDTEPVSLERAKLVTASFKETEGLLYPIRRARAFEKIVTGIPIYIDDDQLLAGDFASRPMAAEWFPEFTVEWVMNVVKGSDNSYNINNNDIREMEEICDYWKDKAVKETFYRFLGEEKINSIYQYNEQGCWVFAASMEVQTEKGWNIPNYEKVIKKGISGLLKEVEDELNATRPLDNESFSKISFLQALKIDLNAATLFARRYAALARDLSEGAEGRRKDELLRIAEVCERVPEHPARNFHEALQCMWFCHLLMYWDTRTVGISPGRVDQYLYPYYKNDIDQGKLSREEAVEFLECFRIKLSAQRQFYTSYVREATSGETQFHNCTLGGQTPDGRDATNELSYLWLEAAERTRTPHPTLSIRWHKNISMDFAVKAAKLCRLGMGYPAWFGDKAAIKYLLEKGASTEEAMDYAVAGCVLQAIPHKTATTWPTIMNMAKILEITLNNGTDPVTGKDIGLKTGTFDECTSFEMVYEAYKQQVRYFLSKSTEYLNNVRLFRELKMPEIFCSAFFDDCIKRGQSVAGGGAHYQHSSMYCMPIGVIDVADSLAAVKRYIYEEKKLSKKDLMDALEANFKDEQEIRDLLLNAPKYGNDDDYVDNIAADIYEWLTEMLWQIEGPYGSRYVNAPHNLSFHGATGRRVGALPSGRLAGISLADGAVSPCQGMDKKGPTAVINSAGKINHVPIYGTLFNMKFHPGSLKTEQDIRKFLALIGAYFEEYEGKHMQFNVIDRETLIDARENPANYRNLVIRVAGYSALWVELDTKIQDEIIERTTHYFS